MLFLLFLSQVRKSTQVEVTVELRVERYIDLWYHYEMLVTFTETEFLQQDLGWRKTQMQFL